MLVRRVADAFQLFTLFGKRGFFMNIVAELGQFQCIAVQMRDIVGNNDAGGIRLRPFTDAVSGILGRLAAQCLSAEISPPGPVTGTHRTGQFLAMCVGARHSAEVHALTDTHAGHEKTQRRCRCLGGWGLGVDGIGAHQQQAGSKACAFHY